MKETNPLERKSYQLIDEIDYINMRFNECNDDPDRAHIQHKYWMKTNKLHDKLLLVETIIAIELERKTKSERRG